MTECLSEPFLAQISEAIAGQTGLHFPRERWRDLERGLKSVALASGHPDVESCARWLLSAPLDQKGIEILASELTVGETYFFREKQSLDLLADHILPEIVRSRQGDARRLRLWSAGCCTGEEPYTLAILLDRIFPDLKHWQVTILGTDLNPRFLSKAREGVYSEWSFRNAPSWLKDNYFTALDGKRFAIIPRIKERVQFAYLNLVEDNFPSLTTNTNAMDVIFCRNVLMYFSTAGTKQVVRRFRQALVPGGWFIVSATEICSERFAELTPVPFPEITLYRKGDAPRFPAVIPPAEEQATISPLPTFFVEEPAPPPLELPTPVDLLPTLRSYEDARILFEQGKPVEASDKLKSDPTSLESNPESGALLARIYANLGDLAQARAWAEKALAADKLNAGLHYLRAIILQEQGVAEEVVPALKRALYLDPNFVLAHFALGNVASHGGNFTEADRHFANALDLLAGYSSNDVLAESDGLAAGQLKEMVKAAMTGARAA